VLLVVEARRSPRSVASWPQKQILTPAGALVYAFIPNQYFSVLTVPVHAQNLAQRFLREIGHGIKEKRTV
jgi:hypothetical protein